MKIVAAPPVKYDLKPLNKFGYATLLIGLGGFLLWSLLTPLQSAVVAPGTLQVLSQNKQVQHLEGGIVQEIFVTENQEVSAGDVLLRLDETFAGAEHQRLVLQEHELAIREAMLAAQRDGSEAIRFPEMNEQSLPPGWLSEQVATAERLFTLGRDNLNNELAITDQRLSQLRQQAKGLKREREAKLAQLGFMEEEIESWKGMVEKKLANKLRFLEVQSEAAELQGVIAKTEAQYAEVQVKIGEVELEKLQVQQRYQESAAKELRDIQFSLKDVRERLATSENVLGRVDIRSPVDGSVTGLKIHTVGAVVRPGDIVMEIVPARETLIVESRVSPTDVDKVYKGMESRIRLASFKQHEMPQLHGVVDSISADVFEDERNQTQYYLARIRIEGVVDAPDDIDSNDSGVSTASGNANDVVKVGATSSAEPGLLEQMHPGMPTEVMIITGESTPAQYLMDPLLNAFNRAWRDS